MKKIFSFLIPAIVLSLTFSSCNNDDNISATGVNLQDSATLFLENTMRLNATVQPTNATNQNVTWQSTDPTVATISNGTVTSVSAGTTSIVATTQDGNFADTVVVNVGTFNCNANTPNWGESLGTVSFYTNQEWRIEGNGITQIWSDAVTATACQDTAFSGFLTEDRSNNADCRTNYPGFPGDFFSWCAVVRFADVLCPYPWRVPTTQDFRNLDIALGGSGESRSATSSDIATPEFVQDNFITRWGGVFGGWCGSVGNMGGHGLHGTYWSQSYGEYDQGVTSGWNLVIDTNGYILLPRSSNKKVGYSLRCVR